MIINYIDSLYSNIQYIMNIGENILNSTHSRRKYEREQEEQAKKNFLFTFKKKRKNRFYFTIPFELNFFHFFPFIFFLLLRRLFYPYMDNFLI